MKEKWYQLLGIKLGLLTYCTSCRSPKWFHFTCPLEMAQNVAQEYFVWIEMYHPLKHFWEVGNEFSESVHENYPYHYFKDIAKKKLAELIVQRSA